MILTRPPIKAGAGECICTARLCYEKLHLYEEGLAWARRALRKDDASSDHFLHAGISDDGHVAADLRGSEKRLGNLRDESAAP